MTEMAFQIYRKAVLQEDEGLEHRVGQVVAESEEAALVEAERRFGGNYFSASDFKAVPPRQAKGTMTVFPIYRKAVLQEDEGLEHYQGEVVAESEEAALVEAEKRFGDNYFNASDFRTVPPQQPEVTNEPEL